MAVYIVYIREAHPTDGWQVARNEREKILVKQPTSDAERADVAQTCVKQLKFSMPCLIDDLKDSTNKAYAAWPDRLYVVDIDGKIAYKGGPGPGGFKPLDAEKVLKSLLANKGRIQGETGG